MYKRQVHKFFENSAVPEGILTTQDDDIDDKELRKLRRQYEDQTKGINNAHRVIIMPKGMEWKALTVSPRVAGMLEVSEWSREEILAGFEVNPMIVGWLENAALANVQEQRRDWYESKFLPETALVDSSMVEELAEDLGLDKRRTRIRRITDGVDLGAGMGIRDSKKRIKVDAHLRTTTDGVWAIGDVVAGPMLAHKAEEDGVAVAEWIAGKAGHIDWNLVPAIVYTDPEVASVGLGEDAAKNRGVAVRVGKFSFAANGRALVSDAADGFVKLIAEAKTDRLLDAQILGRGAGELIGEVVAHMSYGGSAEDLARTIHAHPTMSEAVKEAALAVSKSALHAL